MNDSEFKSSVVKILKELAKYHANDNSIDMNLTLGEESQDYLDEYADELVKDQIQLDTSEIIMEITHDGSTIDLQETLQPKLDIAATFSGDTSNFIYSIPYENDIDASIVSGHFLEIPTVSAQLPSYELTVSVGITKLGFDLSNDVPVKISFTD